ncbi:hypothetical protein ACIBL6_01515 [Streptomyces sp. NPDC050400]|uniref:hypothetical protein n=1 Tax=Streptomyces sp. NPDC050400 TaxID=3365610 RepID=UPI0037A3F12D
MPHRTLSPTCAVTRPTQHTSYDYYDHHDRHTHHARHETISTVPDARGRSAVEHVVRELALAADKVAAHYADPTKYPMPTDRSAPEQLLAERFYDVPDDRKKRAAATVLAEPADGAARVARLGGLARVDLRSRVSVETQVSRLPMPAQLALPVRKSAVRSAGFRPEPVGASTAPPLHHLELRVQHVVCRDETDEWGADPVRIAAVCVGPDGAAHRTDTLEAGRFHSGDTVAYGPPRPLHRFTLAHPGDPIEAVEAADPIEAADRGVPGGRVPMGPDAYLGLLVLSTQDPRDARDGDALVDHVARLLSLARRKVGALLGPADPRVPAAACVVVGELFDRLRRRHGDDTFRPVALRATVPARTSRWPDGRTACAGTTADFRGHGGHYQVTYDWRLSA